MGNATKALSGTASGAASGAALGSAILPGIGTVIGGVGGGLAGLLGGLFDNSDQDAMDQLKKNQALYGNISTPTFDPYNPEHYQVAGLYDPTMAEAQTTSEDPALRSQQMAVMNKMAGLADTGLSAVDSAGYEKAREMGDQMAHSGEQAAEQAAAARGVSGSGTEFAMREAANQGGAGRAMDAGLTQAGDSAKMRAMYAQMLGQDASGIRSQDFGVNSANTDILNRFEQLNTQAKNQGKQYNLNNTQSVSNANVGLDNDAAKYKNTMAQQQYEDQIQKAGGQAGANTAAAGGYAAQGAANQSGINSAAGLGVQTAALLGKQPATPPQTTLSAETNPVDGVEAKKNAGEPYNPLLDNIT